MLKLSARGILAFLRLNADHPLFGENLKRTPLSNGTSESPCPSCFRGRFLSSLRSRLKLLHPSPNCTLREEHMVHVHFKEEIGIAELIPLVTTYIILFAYIYFSTRKLQEAEEGAGGGKGMALSLSLSLPNVKMICNLSVLTLL